MSLDLRGISRQGNINSVKCEPTFEDLKIQNGVQMVRHCIPRYIGPSKANDWSNKVWLAAELDRLVERTATDFLVGRQTEYCWFLHEEPSSFGGG